MGIILALSIIIAKLVVVFEILTLNNNSYGKILCNVEVQAIRWQDSKGTR